MKYSFFFSSYLKRSEKLFSGSAPHQAIGLIADVPSHLYTCSSHSSLLLSALLKARSASALSTAGAENSSRVTVPPRDRGHSSDPWVRM